jgi:hypothetical protein
MLDKRLHASVNESQHQVLDPLRCLDTASDRFVSVRQQAEHLEVQLAASGTENKHEICHPRPLTPPLHAIRISNAHRCQCAGSRALTVGSALSDHAVYTPEPLSLLASKPNIGCAHVLALHDILHITSTSCCH